jgi:hypothetical protein
MSRTRQEGPGTALTPFAAVFILKTLVYGAIAGVVLTGQPGERLLGVVNVYTARMRA